MGKDHDYAGPSSGKTRHISRAKEGDDRAVAERLEKHLHGEKEDGTRLTTNMEQRRLSKYPESSSQDHKGKGKAKAAAPKDRNLKSTSATSASKGHPAERHTGESSFDTAALKTQDRESKSPYPKAIAEALEDLRQWAKEILSTKCRKCKKRIMKGFSIAQYFAHWMTMHSSKKEFSVCSMACPDSACGAETCLGCEQKPRIGRNTATASGLKLDWCCTNGQAFALWVVLCKYDEEELKIQSESARSVASAKQAQNTSRANPGQGSGYMGWLTSNYGPPNPSKKGIGYAGMPSGSPQSVNVLQSLKNAGEKTDRMTKDILALCIELLPKEHKKPDPAVSAMIRICVLQDKVGNLLRNDALRNITPRGDLYYAVFGYVEKLGRHPDLSDMACGERYQKERTAGLQALSMGNVSGDARIGGAAGPSLVLSDWKQSMGLSLVDCMAELAKQSQEIISFATKTPKEFEGQSGQDILGIAKRIRRVYNLSAKENPEDQHRPKPIDKASEWQAYYEQNRHGWVTNMISYMRSDLAAAAKSLTYSKPDRVRRIAVEVAEMSTSLPPNVLVRADDVRPDCIKCLIVGPQGTPYEGGLFEFDILCGSNYPQEPPIVMIVTTGGGIINFNPNLYANGKVCLSLLNTWHGGDATERWIPGKSTIRTVLICIQALILCEQPIQNEPGFEVWVNQEPSWDLDRALQARTVRYAMLDWLRNPRMRDGIWGEVVKNYFAANADGIRETVHRWASKNPTIRNFLAPPQAENLLDNMVTNYNLRMVGKMLRSPSGPVVDLLSELESTIGGVKGKGKA